MKDFWRNLIVQVIIRASSNVIIWVAAKGYATSAQAEYAILFGAMILVNVGQTLITRLLARYNIDLARLMPDGTSRKEHAEIASTVNPITKIIEAVTPGANPSAIEAATTAENRTPRIAP